jgi:small subunit ribosomal protein S17
MTDKNQSTKKRKLQGVVVSNKMTKTVVVAVTHHRWQAKYQKQYAVIRKMKAHDETGEYQVGDKVIIEETRPLSKEKRWRVHSLIERAKKADDETLAETEN